MWHLACPALNSDRVCRPQQTGHYRALEWSEQEQKYVENSNLGILVEVDVSRMVPCRHVHTVS